MAQQNQRVRMTEDHDVGPNAFGIEPAPRPLLGHRLGQPLGPTVVVGEPSHHLLQAHQTGGRDHSGLAHGAAEPFAFDARLGDELVRSAQQ